MPTPDDSGSKVHFLKTWPEHYQAVLDGRKRFEWRKDDRGFTEGDVLVLQEYDPQREEYTGEALSVEVTHIVRGPIPAFALPEGYAMMSIRSLVATNSVSEANDVVTMSKGRWALLEALVSAVATCEEQRQQTAATEYPSEVPHRIAPPKDLYFAAAGIALALCSDGKGEGDHLPQPGSGYHQVTVEEALAELEALERPSAKDAS